LKTNFTDIQKLQVTTIYGFVQSVFPFCFKNFYRNHTTYLNIDLLSLQDRCRKQVICNHSFESIPDSIFESVASIMTVRELRELGMQVEIFRTFSKPPIE
jgi:hypothetical protein